MSDQLSQYQQQPQGDDEITLKDIFRTIGGLLGSWPYLLGGALIGVAIAFFVNRYTQNTYELSATVAVEEMENPLASAEGALNLGFSFGGSGILSTRVAVLKSYAHNLRVARNLNWETKHFIEGRLNRREEYKPPYYNVEFDPLHPQLLGAEFKLELRPTAFEISATQFDNLSGYNFDLAEPLEYEEAVELEEEMGSFAYGEWIESSNYRFRITKGEKFTEVVEEDNLTTPAFRFQSYDDVANWGMTTLATESDEKQQSSLLTVKMKGFLKPQLADYMNASIEALQGYELRQKNMMAINTIEFIDGQLIQIESSLRSSEDALEEFRSKNLIVDLSSESEQMLEYFIGLE